LGLSPVEYANKIADWEMLSLMMEKRPDVRNQVLNSAIRDCTDDIFCALRAAAQYGHNDLLKYLINKGNSVNVALLGENSTLIHVAARSQQTETVRLLLLLGASIDCQDRNGMTPLHVSVEIGNLEVIKCLVKHQKTVRTETDLHHILNTRRTVNSRNILSVPDIDRNTPLHLGVTAGNKDIVLYLVSAGSDLNTRNEQGDNPLTLAVRCRKNDVVQLLLKSEVESDESKTGALRTFIVMGDV
jgi:ankyrin repeat protein